MISATREQRFAGLAERELNSGPRREPIWQQARANSSNNATQAEDLYRQLRVEQMLKDEAAFEKEQEALTKLRRFNDGLGYSRRKTILGVFAALVVVLILMGLVFLMSPQLQRMHLAK